jgi:gluconate 2-dehydrogenase gamma chain
MNRRELLKDAAIVLGATVSTSLSSAILAGVSRPTSEENQGKLNQQQMQNLAVLSEMIIPTTDTPGAITAGVPGFINVIFSQWYKTDEQASFLEGLEALNQKSHKTCGSGFAKCSQDQQQLLVRDAERAAADPNSPLGHLFVAMKELTVLGYYTSKVGATQELKYNPVPLSYKGDYLYSDIGKQWSY